MRPFKSANLFTITSNIASDNSSVSLLIGENGSGKSYLLAELANNVSKSHTGTAIAFANTAFDRFGKSKSNLKISRAAKGQYYAVKVIKECVGRVTSTNLRTLESLFSTLEYMGYDASIGIEIRGYSIEAANKLEYGGDGDSERMFELSRLLEKFFSEKPTKNTVWLRSIEASPRLVEAAEYTALLAHEPMLRKLNVVKKLVIHLKKNEKNFAIDGASSGELLLLTNLLYVAAYITPGAWILIDEPECGLHPSWQKEYVRKILDQFHYYSPNLILATHSPLIISGAEVFENEYTRVYRTRNNQVKLVKRDSKNLEELLWEVFNYVSPESTFVSRYFVRKLHELAARETSLAAVLQEINEHQSQSYDSTQIQALRRIRELAIEVGESV